MTTGAHVIVAELERAGVEVCFGLPGVHNLALWEALRASLDPARRRAPRAGRGVRGRRLRAGDRAARRRAHHDRAGRGEHARRRRRGVGVALADPGDRHRHPVDAAAARRVPRHAARDRRPGGDVRAGRRRRPTSALARRGGRAAAARRGAVGAITAPRRPVYLEIATDLLAAERARARRPRRAPSDAAAARAEPRRARSRALDAAERPLIWAGGGARDARRGGRRAGRAPRRAGAHDLRRGGHAPARPPVPVGLPPHAEPAGRAVGRGRPRDRDRLRPRRRPDPELRPAAARRR